MGEIRHYMDCDEGRRGRGRGSRQPETFELIPADLILSLCAVETDWLLFWPTKKKKSTSQSCHGVRDLALLGPGNKTTAARQHSADCQPSVRFPNDAQCLATSPPPPMSGC